MKARLSFRGSGPVPISAGERRGPITRNRAFTGFAIVRTDRGIRAERVVSPSEECSTDHVSTCTPFTVTCTETVGNLEETFGDTIAQSVTASGIGWLAS